MTKSQVKSKCKQIHKGKRHTENFYLVKYENGWEIGTPEQFVSTNKKAIDFELYTI